MEALYEIQKVLQKQIANSYENFKKKGATKMTKVNAQTRLNGLEDWYAQFTSNHKKILALKEIPSTHEYFTQNFYDLVVDLYFDKKGEFTQFLEDLKTTQADQNRTTEPPIPHRCMQSAAIEPNVLPKMNLPKFSGNFSEWENFRDLFRSLVHRRTDFDFSTKFFYLRTHLTGEGMEHIKSIPMAAENYEKAWNTLINYYDNKRRAINTLLKRILSVKPMKIENASELKRVFAEIINPFESLRNLGRTDEDFGNDLIVHLLVQQFENNTKKDWKKSLNNNNDIPPTLAELKNFVESQLVTLESFEENDDSSTRQKTKNSKSRLHKVENDSNTAHSLQTVASNNTKKPPKCVLCSGEHTLAKCELFSKKSVSERREFAKTKRICYNCLGSSHNKQQCKSRYNCFHCRARHHTLLHDSSSRNEAQSEANLTSTNQNSERSVNSNASNALTTSSFHTIRMLGNSSGVLLATAQVCVLGPKNNLVKIKALIDPCSQVTLITQSLCNQLALVSERVHVCIKGIDENSSTTANKLAKCLIAPYFSSTSRLSIEALVLPKLSTYSPPIINSTKQFSHLHGLQLADPEYFKQSKIDLLLGANVYADIVEGRVIKGTGLQPIAISSKLGWLLMGSVPSVPSNSKLCNSHTVHALHCSCSNRNDPDLQVLLQEFWRTEEVVGKNSCTIEEQECEKLFSNSTYREQSGRYVIRLPWKEPARLKEFKIGDSFPYALRALKRLENSFLRDKRLHEEYSRFMKEYIELGHMTYVEDEVPSIDSDYFFLPHHGVWKETSSSTKLRTVFNGSSRLRSGESLNDMLFSGPNLLKSPIDLICRLRLYKIALSADVEKMFRQIAVDKEDRKFQAILWRFNSQEKIQIYRLNTVTYGLTCSPYLALRTLLQMARDHETEYPIAAEVVRNEMYSDNVLTGAHSSSEALDKVKALVALFQRAQMNLRKWSSSDPEALSSLPKEMLVTDKVNLFSSDNVVLLLGIAWHPKGDFFKFHVENVVLEKLITKRSVLSRIARTFDPLGWIAPIVVQAKILLQALWLRKVGWDEQLPADLVEKWTNWVGELPLISEMEIPRWLGFTPQTQLVEIHGFADASKLAYGAVLYLRLVQDSKVLVSLQVAKSKVAPVKTLSIPRLELCAALLLTRLVLQFQSLAKLSGFDVHLWTDSADVLFWLKDHPSRWNVFVANRCSEIHTSVPNAFWHHVKSKDNPADIVSRGIEPSKLRLLDLWWHGPEFLTITTEPWSKRQDELNFSIHNLVLANDQLAQVNSTTNYQPETIIWNLVVRYSSLTKLLRVTSYCIRFLARISRRLIIRTTRQFSILQLSYFVVDNIPDAKSICFSELKNSKLFWCYLVQKAYYPSEYSLLVGNKKLNHKNPLADLNPHVKDHLIRVGGRLINALTRDDSKHPVILPRSSNFTKLLIYQAHIHCLHGGTQLTLATLRQEFWIVRGRTEVRRIIRSCVQCTRYAAQTPSQLMGNLPAARVRPSYPFERAGVDYAGPISVRLTKTRGKGTLKGYICVFVCMATKAIHLEAVEDYTAESFIAAFHRFTSRRGHCKELYSDQGTNFVGADSQLKQMLTELARSYSRISHMLVDLGTEWRFNPPSAPHFGGLWEAAVKSLKHHLRRVIGEQVLTFSELTTLLCRVEACLNSRPVVALTDEPSDLRFLSPAHLLIQRSSYLVPEGDLTCDNIPIGKRWQSLSKMVQHFWTRWSREYLTTLQARSKWLQLKRSPEIGDMVLIRNELYPPGKWPLGRITEVHPGDDGLIRVVTIKTSLGQLRRPIVKLVPLPKSDQKLE